MLTVLNVTLVVVVAALAYFWASQGLFSAFLHLCVTFVAGAVALALWEPLVSGYLLSRMPHYAMGVGLIVPFVLTLVVLRVGLDLLIPGNVNLPQVVNYTAGLAAGLASGVITTGIGLVGIGYLPLPAELVGYQPLTVLADGQVVGEAGTGLWLPVDRYTTGFYAALSQGVLATDDPLALTRPDPAYQANLSRLSRAYDPHSSLVATPQGVNVTQLATRNTPLAPLPEGVEAVLGGEAARPGSQIVIVRSEWTLVDAGGSTDGTYDSDRAVRVPPTQIRLIGWADVVGVIEPRLHAPVAVAISGADGTSTLRSLKSSTYVPASKDAKATLDWVFVLPAAETPKFIDVRNLRFALPETLSQARTDAMIQQALSNLQLPTTPAVPVKPGTPAKPVAKPPVNAKPVPPPAPVAKPLVDVTVKAIVFSPELPRPIAIARAGSLDVVNQIVASGAYDVPADPSVAPASAVKSLAVPEGKAVLRVTVARQMLHDLFGNARTDRRMGQAIWVEEAPDQKNLPFAYVWLRADGSQFICVNPDEPLEAIHQLPVKDMAGNDELALYFAVPPDSKAAVLRLGDEHKQSIPPSVR